MAFDKEISLIQSALSGPLPGVAGQHIMAPRQRQTTEELLRESTSHRLSSVILLLYPDQNGKVQTIFIERPISKSVHSGQIALPGGKVEPSDPGPRETALRETEEEIGVPSNEIEIIGNLSSLFIPASNFLVYPFVGVINNTPQFVPNPEEVRSLIPASLKEVLTLQTSSKQFQTSYGLLSAPCYDLKGHSMWGATAMMVSEFREMMLKADRR